MQVISAGLQTALKTQTTLTLKPKVEIEWNHNRFAETVTVTNASGSRDWSGAFFPMASIVENNRPTSGLTKALVNDGRVSTNTSKFYAASQDDIFKYWISPGESSSSSPYTITDAGPTVVYGANVKANKVYVCFDVQWQKPTEVDLFITTDGSIFTEVGSNLTPNSEGVIELYYNGSAWSTTKNLTSSTTIRGVRAIARSMNRPSVRCHVIELAAKLHKDISADVSKVSVDKVREELDPSIPYGVAQSDRCSLEIANIDNKYSEYNATSEFYGLIQKNAKLTLQWDYEGFSDDVQTGIFYTQSWNFATDAATIGLEAADYSVYLQETKMPICFYRHKTGSYIVRDILAKIGFNNIRFNINGTERQIPYVWFDDKSTVWEALVNIAKAEQASFFFDRLGRFRYQDFTHVYTNRTTPTWTFRSNEDLVRVQNQFNVLANSVAVKYKTYTPNMKNDKPLNSVLWRADEDVVLRAAPLRSKFTSTETVVDIGREKARFWPEKGYINIEGEYMRFNGYWPNGSDPTSPNSTKWPTGVKVRERGLFGSTEQDHVVDLAGWQNKQYWQGGGGTNMTRTLENGSLRLRNAYKNDLDDRRWGMTVRGHNNSKYRIYGTKMKFIRPTETDSGTWHTMAGMVLHGSETDTKAAYYFELVSQTYADVNRPDIGNIRCYKMAGNYTRTGLPSTDLGKAGYPFDVVPNRWYTVEITHQASTFTLYVDGKAITTFTDSTFNSGMWGMYVRGNTDCLFEYAYVYNPLGDGEDIHSQRILDRRDGAYASGYAAKERRSPEGTNWFFDEFAPVAHEVREFDVDYQIQPALSHKPLSTNDYEAQVFRSGGTAFGMKFIMDNASREDATLNGQDFSIVSGEAVPQYLFVYGHALLEGEEKEEVAKDDVSIRKNGLVELQVNSPWIQTKERAQAIAEFLKDTWGSPVDVATADVFANPALELGDLIAIDYDEYDIQETTHKYYITAITMDYDGGLGQTLTLRRVR